MTQEKFCKLMLDLENVLTWEEATSRQDTKVKGKLTNYMIEFFSPILEHCCHFSYQLPKWVSFCPDGVTFCPKYNPPIPALYSAVKHPFQRYARIQNTAKPIPKRLFS